MTNQNLYRAIEDKLMRALDAVCEVEAVCLFDFERTTDEHNMLNYTVTIERQQEPDVMLSFPIYAIANESSQWITLQMLKACGWQKIEVDQPM